MNVSLEEMSSLASGNARSIEQGRSNDTQEERNTSNSKMNIFSHAITLSLLLLLGATTTPNSLTNAAQQLIIPHPSLAPAPSPHHHHHHHHHHLLHSPSSAPAQPPSTTTPPPPHKPPTTAPPAKPPTAAPPHKPPTTAPPAKPPTAAPPHKPPTTAPPAKPPTAPPAKPPTPYKPMPRKFVAIQGVVYCKNCSYVGVDTLLAASPLAGAKVLLKCRNTKYVVKSSARTDKNGYFLIQAPPLITTYGTRKCHVSLSKKHVVGTCSNPTNLHGGLTGAPLVLDPSSLTKPVNFTLFTVGPFAYEPPKKCSIQHSGQS